VWSIPTRPSRQPHFATFPIDLPLRCVAAGCPPEGVVLDPFAGISTTGLAALQLGRSYVGVDLNSTYLDLGIRRLSTENVTVPPASGKHGDREQP
jgi:DNA modification methylase